MLASGKGFILESRCDWQVDANTSQEFSEKWRQVSVLICLFQVFNDLIPKI